MTDLADALRPIVAQLVAEALAARSAVATDAPDRLLGVEEAAAALGIGRTATYELIARGRLASCRVGRRRMVAAADLRDFIERTRAGQ